MMTLSTIRLRVCPPAEREHEKSLRQYAHTGHYQGAICVAKEFFDLPLQHALAILIHELGHLSSEGGEREADEEVRKMFGVRIIYVDSPWGRKLEFLLHRDLWKVLTKLRSLNKNLFR